MAHMIKDNKFKPIGYCSSFVCCGSRDFHNGRLKAKDKPNKGEEVTKVCDDWKKDTLDKAYNHEEKANFLQTSVREHNELMLMYAKNISELMAKLADHLKSHSGSV